MLRVRVDYNLTVSALPSFVSRLFIQCDAVLLSREVRSVQVKAQKPTDTASLACTPFASSLSFPSPHLRLFPPPWRFWRCLLCTFCLFGWVCPRVSYFLFEGCVPPRYIDARSGHLFLLSTFTTTFSWRLLSSSVGGCPHIFFLSFYNVDFMF